MPGFIDAQGQTQQIDLSVTMYRQAADAGMSLPQYINSKYPTNSEKYGTAFDQLLEATGLYVRSDNTYGIRPATMQHVLHGSPEMQAGTVVKDGVPASRILFPAVVLSAIENKLLVDLDMNANAFDQMIAVDDSINSDRFERPVLNFSNPEGARTGGISQLALPNSMLSITASDVSRKIPARSIGMEISDQALRSTSLDLVTLAVARQAAVERNERALEYLLAMLQGDKDLSMVALANIANKVIRANQLDTGVTVAGTLSQKAWMAWLFRNATKRRITHVVTDINGALAIEARSGKPTVSGDDPKSTRIDTNMSVINPLWPDTVQVFINTDANWPANTIMGIDARYAIHRVKSLSLQYEATEQYVMRRSQQMRIDSGEIVYRLFDEAFEVLSLALS